MDEEIKNEEGKRYVTIESGTKNDKSNEKTEIITKQMSESEQALRIILGMSDATVMSERSSENIIDYAKRFRENFEQMSQEVSK